MGLDIRVPPELSCSSRFAPSSAVAALSPTHSEHSVPHPFPSRSLTFPHPRLVLAAPDSLSLALFLSPSPSLALSHYPILPLFLPFSPPRYTSVSLPPSVSPLPTPTPKRAALPFVLPALSYDATACDGQDRSAGCGAFSGVSSKRFRKAPTSGRGPRPLRLMQAQRITSVQARQNS